MCSSFLRPCFFLSFFFSLFIYFPTSFLTSFFPNSVSSSSTVFGQSSRAHAFALAESDRKEQLRHWNAPTPLLFSCLSKYLRSFPFQLPGTCAGCQPTTKDNTRIPCFFLHAILLQDSGFGKNH